MEYIAPEAEAITIAQRCLVGSEGSGQTESIGVNDKSYGDDDFE